MTNNVTLSIIRLGLMWSPSRNRPKAVSDIVDDDLLFRRQTLFSDIPLLKIYSLIEKFVIPINWLYPKIILKHYFYLKTQKY